MTFPALNEGLYSAVETDRTYRHVLRLARIVVGAGFPVIVDGTFLQRRQRDQVHALATAFDVPLVIVDFVAPVDVLRARVRRRREAGVDASDADVRVLEHQLQTGEPLTPDERALTVLLVQIALINVFNRLNVPMRRPAGSWK